MKISNLLNKNTFIWLALVTSCIVAAGFTVQAFQAQAAGSTNIKETPQIKASPIDLHENNWELMLKGEWMVEFFAPWCPACKNLAPTWEKFSANARDFNVKVAKIDVTTSPSLSGRFFVTALPTIYHVKNGQFRQYRGSRDAEAFINFIKQKQWQKIDPISTWKKPDSLHMSILSYFFKLSHMLKDINTQLQEQYGLPTWGSYGLFAIGTIFIGAALGLMLVCIVDFLCPPKKAQRQSFSETRDNFNSIEDIAKDEIEDDEPQQKDIGEDEDVEIDENEGSSSESEKYSESEKEEEKTVKKDTTSKVEINEPEPKTVASGDLNTGDVRKRKPRKDN